MPTQGPWKPIHRTPLPRKSNVAVCPGAKPMAAVPPLHGRDVLPRFQPALYAMAVSPSSIRSVVPLGLLNVTLLSVLVEAVLPLPAPSLATPAGIVALTVPLVVMPLPATV